MGDRELRDLVAGEPDECGRVCATIYYQEHGIYAVYATAERLVVRFSDDPERQLLQRRRLVGISDLRGEIASVQAFLAQRDAEEHWWRRARPDAPALPPPEFANWNVQVAGAIKDALEGSPEAAHATLTRVRDEILAERQAKGRLLYLRLAAGAVVGVAFVAFLMTSPWTLARTDGDAAVIVNLWRAVAAGALGAFFSIARAITERTVRADNRASDYVADALTRIAVGCIAALVLEALLDSGLFSVKFAGVDTIGAGRGAVALTSWPITIVAGFLAGFSERLIPDLMASYAVGARPEPPAGPAAGTAPAAEPVAPSPTGSTVQPGTTAAARPQPLPDDPRGVEVPEPAGEEDQVDACDRPDHDDAPVTDDADLPVAVGGGAKG